MPVNLQAPDPDPNLGRILAAIGNAGVADLDVDNVNLWLGDLLVIALDQGSRVAGVFTRNRFCAAPVRVCQRNLASWLPVRALVVNTGNANAGTGDAGMLPARATCDALGQLLGVQAGSVLPFSTGVIMERLPVERLIAALPAAIADLRGDHWARAAETIMTTDTVAKAASRRIEIDGVTVTVTGIAKGAGMIRPDMATMLGFIATDAPVVAPLLDRLVHEVAGCSFNRVSVDGDTSTNDSFVLIASAAAPLREIATADDPRLMTLRAALIDVAQQLAQAIARDGEGATKFITIDVEGGRDEAECCRVGTRIWGGSSPRSAMPASPISTSITSTCGSAICWSRSAAGAPRATPKPTASAR